MASEGTVRVRVPAPLRTLTGGKAELAVQPGTLRSMIDELEQQYPGFRARLCKDGGGLNDSVNFFVDEEDVRFLNGIDTPLAAGARVSILPAVAGGAR